MTDFILLMWKPLLACIILTGIHAYLGIHVVERGVIFVDLSLAQIAALGATIALLFGYDLHDSPTYWFSLLATFAGAVIFALSRSHRSAIPQEAVIGIVYAVSAAAAVLMLSRTPEGDEHIRHMLVGNILLVSLPEIAKMAALYVIVGMLHWRFREPLVQISISSQQAHASGKNIKKWDLFFYLTFGFVVTSSVELAGVLLVFSFLIVPAVAAMLYHQSFRARLIFGWIFATAVSFVGIAVSYFFDLPTGASVVCAFGFFLLLLMALRRWIPVR